MISVETLPDGDVAVTFTLADGRGASLVGDFNEWDPHSHLLVPDDEGHRSISIVVPADTVIRFRYLDDGGEYFDDPAADFLEPNGYDGTNSVIDLSLHRNAPSTAVSSDDHRSIDLTTGSEVPIA